MKRSSEKSTIRHNTYRQLRAKRALTLLRCSVENQKGATSVYIVYGNSAFLVLIGTSLNSIMSFWRLSRQYTSLIMLYCSENAILAMITCQTIIIVTSMWKIMPNIQNLIVYINCTTM